jgi:hypothetical protein
MTWRFSTLQTSFLRLDRDLRSDDDVQAVLAASRTTLETIAQLEALDLKRQKREYPFPEDHGFGDEDRTAEWRGTAHMGRMFVRLLEGNLGDDAVS